MPAYYIRARLEIGNLSKKASELSFVATRHFTKEFGYLPLFEQKEILQSDFLEIIDVLDGKLKKKKIKYDVRLLRQDMLKIFATW
jgi:hypothetical protein